LIVRKRLEELKGRCESACQKAGRPYESVRIVAVSKGQPIEKIMEAYELGVRDFGENYAAEMAQKVAALKDSCPDIIWHFIGHIQSNKMRMIAAASWVHSLSELSHAKLLGQDVGVKKKKALLQVNLGDEENRNGVSESELCTRYQQIMRTEGVDLCGLMTIAPLHENIAPSVWFAKMQALRENLQKEIGESVPELSMGMSEDFEEAILCGATWIRVGTLLFGERQARAKS
jgi:pyridoxal phosphate enzyme (YggS family)